MGYRSVFVVLLLILLFAFTGSTRANFTDSKDQPALVYVDLNAPNDLTRFASTHLPMYTMLAHGLLTGANHEGQQALQDAELNIQVLDPDLHSGIFYLATTHSIHTPPDFAAFGQVLLKLDNGVLLRMDSSQVETIAQAGAELQAITLTPKPLPLSHEKAFPPYQVDPDPIIQSMIDQVTVTQVYTYDRQLAGELPVWVDGGEYFIPTRSTNSGIPIQKTTHYVGEHMQNLGMGVDYHVWSNNTNPDVIGEIPGLLNPDDVFIIGAHIDDVNGTEGADDNASGSVATLLAADILSQYQWGCTLRFAFWTGEEQGLLGSEDYAQEAHDNFETILGYLNLDMIAWNTIGSPPKIYLDYNPTMPSTLDLANLFADVIASYKINLIPELGTQVSGGSDHSSFWNLGYPAILAIEHPGDFNPNYHKPGDIPANTDPTYFTNFIKASIATYAHMSGCLISDGTGYLDGHVTAASGGTPIQGATVTATDSNGKNYSVSTDVTGYYTRTLIADTYTVTASAYGYLPSMVSGINITPATVATQDFALVSAPTHTVSGKVTEYQTGLPLLAKVSFDSAPVVVWTNPDTGDYQAVLPENSYDIHVKADQHRPQEQNILLDHDQTQNFILEPLPCILLVDDDQDSPDLNTYYTEALDLLGEDYDVWDTSIKGDPSLNDISGYCKVLWYTGRSYYNTFDANNENTISAYLDAGGNFFLSSQDYLWEMQITPFGENYLHILSYQNDRAQTSVIGQNVFGGLGSYTLSYPFVNYSDVVNPDGQSLVAFSGNKGNAAISYAGENFNTVFFGFPFESIPQAADRRAVIWRILDFFPGCEPISVPQFYLPFINK